MASSQHIKDIDYEHVKALKDDKNVLIIDVREPSELVETGIIPGSINIPLNDVQNVLQNTSSTDFENKYKRFKPNMEFPLVFSCKAGGRSLKAAEIAVKLGFKNVSNYRGWLDWEKNLQANT